MKWREAHATGIPEVDEQHRRLFSAVHDFRDALNADESKDSCGPLLTFLEKYTREHFIFEERCMERHRCPMSRQNRDEHAALLATLAVHRKWYVTGGYDPHDAHTLLDALEHWMDSHICRVDVLLKQCIKA